MLAGNVRDQSVVDCQADLAGLKPSARSRSEDCGGHVEYGHDREPQPPDRPRRRVRRRNTARERRCSRVARSRSGTVGSRSITRDSQQLAACCGRRARGAPGGARCRSRCRNRARRIAMESEVARTAAQLQHYADVAAEGSWLGATVDRPSGADTPELRRLNVPVGPVAVLGSSNFPLAFGIVGNDTGSAIAAVAPSSPRRTQPTRNWTCCSPRSRSPRSTKAEPPAARSGSCTGSVLGNSW